MNTATPIRCSVASKGREMTLSFTLHKEIRGDQYSIGSSDFNDTQHWDSITFAFGANKCNTSYSCEFYPGFSCVLVFISHRKVQTLNLQPAFAIQSFWGVNRLAVRRKTHSHFKCNPHKPPAVQTHFPWQSLVRF